MNLPLSAKTYKQELDKKGINVWMSPKWVRQFQTLDAKLLAQGIDPEIYVRTSLQVWDSWVSDKRLKYLPVHVLCGSAVFNKFMEDYGSLSISVPDDMHDDSELHWGLVLHYECGAAEIVVRELGNGMSMQDVDAMLREEWLPDWWDTSIDISPEVHDRAQVEAIDSTLHRYGLPRDEAIQTYVELSEYIHKHLRSAS